jgi:hypothetical protein
LPASCSAYSPSARVPSRRSSAILGSMGVEPDPVITCIDCGGRAHLLTPPRDDPEDLGADEWQPGDVVTYRCEDCLDRWDLVLDDDAIDDT